MAKVHKARQPEEFLPLPSATLHILVALSGGEMHGYAIMNEVERVSSGVVRMGPGTLYGTLKRMLADGLVEETAERPDPAIDDQRRRYYRLTSLGEQVCSAEIARLRQLIRSLGSPKWAQRRVPGLRNA